jgi:ribosome-interacting GTPase 1
MARTQKNKATAGHLGMLKAKLAKLRRELIQPKGGGGGAGEAGFEVRFFDQILQRSLPPISN